MTLQKKDFIEVEFTGRIKDSGQIFDSNIKEELDKLNSQAKAEPFVYCLSEGMFLEGIDNYLIGKDIGKHEISLEAEKAFGKRDSKAVQMIPMKVFRQQQINPVPGVSLNFDGKVGKILSVSSGRVLVDFNNPLAGKDVEYTLEVKRKVENVDEKLKAFNEFLFRKNFDYKIEGKKLILEVDKPMVKFVDLFKDKFKEIFDFDLEIKEVEVKQPKKE